MAEVVDSKKDPIIVAYNDSAMSKDWDKRLTGGYSPMNLADHARLFPVKVHVPVFLLGLMASDSTLVGAAVSGLSYVAARVFTSHPSIHRVRAAFHQRAANRLMHNETRVSLLPDDLQKFKNGCKRFYERCWEFIGADYEEIPPLKFEKDQLENLTSGKKVKLQRLLAKADAEITEALREEALEQATREALAKRQDDATENHLEQK